MKQTDRERTAAKQKLRRGMVQAEEKPNKEKENPDKKLRRHRLRKTVMIAVLVLFFAAGLIALTKFRGRETLKGHTVSWEKEISTTDRDIYAAFGSFVLRCSRDGVTYLNSSGDAVWSQSFEMSDPAVVVNGGYAVVYDRGGYQLYICSETGCTGTVSTILPIHKAAVSAAGVTAAAVEDDLADKVYFYDMAGRQMDIEMKTLLTQDGYTLDMALSPDGTQMVSSYVYLDQGTMKNQVVFRNFGEEGQEMIKRLVGGFREYEGHMVARTVFLTDEAACAFAEDRLCFYSLRNRLSPSLVKQIDFPGEIYSIFYSPDYVGVISEGDGSGSRKVSVFDRSGSEVTEFALNFACTGANFSGGHIVFYDSVSCEIYSLRGELTFAGDMGADIRWLFCPSENTMLLIDGGVVRELKLTP